MNNPQSAIRNPKSKTPQSEMDIMLADLEARKVFVNFTEATGEIAAMIGEVQADTVQVAMAISESTELADSAQKSIAEIVAGIQTVQDMVQQIAAAAEEQARTSGEVAEALSSLAQASQQISSATQQTATATEDLSEMVEGLGE